MTRSKTKLPRQLEKHVQAACKAVLEANGCRVFRRNTGVVSLEHKGKSRVFRAGETGAADLYGFFPNGTHFECEVKRPGERPTLAQTRFLSDCARRGIPAFWVDSADDLARILPTLLDGGQVVYTDEPWTFREYDKKLGRVVVTTEPGAEFEVWCKGYEEAKHGR